MSESPSLDVATTEQIATELYRRHGAVLVAVNEPGRDGDAEGTIRLYHKGSRLVIAGMGRMADRILSRELAASMAEIEPEPEAEAEDGD